MSMFPKVKEPTNEERAQWACEAMLAHEISMGNSCDAKSIDEQITDLMANLLHLCKREGLQVSQMICRSMNHYNAEKD